jgi:hypothetical protein
MVIALLFGGYTNRATIGTWALNNLALWVLLALLGWKVFGPIVHN